MPFYDHLCSACGHEWEDFYGARKDPPTVCPSCGVEGQTKRLISDRISVRCPLQGRDLVEQINKEKKQIARDVERNEELKANIAGESSYHQAKLHSDAVEKNLKNI